MRLSVMVFGLVCVCALVIGTAAPVFQDDEDVRGAFLTSRPKDKPVSSSGSTPKTAGRRKPKPPTGGGSTGGGSGHSGGSGNTGSGTTGKTDKTPKPKPSPSPSTPTPVNAHRLGLGVTLFMRDSNGLAVRVDPDHVFQKGDRVRVVLETNTDGYLYIFNTTDDGPATMIYPDSQLDDAGNYLQSHVPFEIPSAASADERLRWFAFDQVAGTEHLFFVFTREPLSGIPIDDDLIASCKDSKERCMRPSDEVWAAVKTHMQEPLKTDKDRQFGSAQTSTEQQATSRGLGLSKEDPPPSLVMMASSPRSTLVATLDLIHK
ncbi:MAG TPA: DUF4384 domain-containing protein [Pyrinomonadaceae bacterium]|nr:DUF4384 domain-containing protein [Pyrinomonadaceae bacterium]